MSETRLPKKVATIAKERATAIKEKATPVNLELSTEEVSAIIKKLTEEKLVVPVIDGTNPNAFGSNGCCVDVNVSVAGPVSTIGANRPTAPSLRETLAKKNVNVVIPQNLKIK